MEKQESSPKDSPKQRRPLPTPGSQPPPQRPTTPIPVSTFYGDAKPPPLPNRPSGVGSSSTTLSYVPTASATPPAYNYSASGSADYREPELVKDERVDNDDVPPLTEVDWNQWNTQPNWDGVDWNTQYGGSSWGVDWSSSQNDSGSRVRFGWGAVAVPIDDRNESEEIAWWDPAERQRHGRPGPGMLPPVLADELHDPEHTLYSVNVTPPDVYPEQPQISSSEQSQKGTLNAPSTSSSSPSPSSSLPNTVKPIPPPTAEEVRTAVPHPNAYYCPKENAWVILSWRSSSVIPPLALSFQKSQNHLLPDQTRRKRTTNCIGDEENTLGGPSNKTHHFHKYPKAVDAFKLTPPFRGNEWDVSEAKQRKRAGTIDLVKDFDLEKLKTQVEEEEESQEDEGILLDLYMCCQCSFYCVASDMQSGVIPLDIWKDFTQEKMSHPPVDKTPETSLVGGLETLLMMIENALWKSEVRALRVNSQSFQRKIGWSDPVRRIFGCLNFIPDTNDREPVVRAPPCDTTTVLGRNNRAKLLRAWVEIGAWMTHFKKTNDVITKLRENTPHKLWVTVDPAREMYQTAIGAHHDQISRGNLNDSLLEPMMAVHRCFLELGLTITSYSADILSFAYLAQCRCDPAQTMEYFTAFSTIVKIMEQVASCPTELQELMMMEQSRQRFTAEELQSAAETLGFGSNGALRVDYDNDIEDEFIENAWKECIKRSWTEADPRTLQRAANDALRIVAEAKGSVGLKALYDKGNNSLMLTPERAYDVLEVPRDIDETMLITIFGMRVEEQPSQIERMQEALNVIAEVRGSERLREFIRTSRDPGEAITVTPPDWPRGLNQLGNTCYLNSLLQARLPHLREAVIPLGKVDLKSIEEEKFSDDALTKHRVGGRLVTRREVQRSRKFVNHLADLFRNLEHSQATAITPAIELAKLALVTSKDEEEDEVDQGGTDASNDTDATLVEDGPSRFSIEPERQTSPQPQSPGPSPGSILGKRPRRASEMDIDITLVPQESASSLPTQSISRANSLPQPHTDSSKLGESSTPVLSVPVKDIEVQDVEMKDVSQSAKKVPPPLPPRKTPVKNDSVMMFGRQHDVAECMDNCMFQIETAMLKFDEVVDTPDEEDTNSIVKHLFYGKIRQRFVETTKGQPTIHAKEDLFSHLPVNVAEDGFDIYDGLGRFFDDVIEYEGQRVPIEVSLLKLPPLLQIQLQRVQFNRETVQSWKSQAYVKFEETIYMDRFMDTADPQKRKQSKTIQEDLHACRERIRLLTQGKDPSFGTSLENTSKFLSESAEVLKSAGIDVDPELSDLLSQEQKTVQSEIDQLRTRIAQQKATLEDIWKDDKRVPYELTSVFIHRGTSPSFGHYFFYSRNLPSNPDEWFKYNDSDVSKIDKEEVLQDTTGSTANPYLLVFARKGSQVVDTVKRSDLDKIVEIDN
ncbi:ubiquitin carboxyl-terminal hydrolase [Moniliophthora roreri]|nr:ubiquitin carboxyl-terminal hydrolase [Moniliophthora roreri]